MLNFFSKQLKTCMDQFCLSLYKPVIQILEGMILGWGFFCVGGVLLLHLIRALAETAAGCFVELACSFSNFLYLWAQTAHLSYLEMPWTLLLSDSCP